MGKRGWVGGRVSSQCMRCGSFSLPPSLPNPLHTQTHTHTQVNKEAEHRERLQDLSQRVVAARERIASEEGFMPAARKRREEGESELAQVCASTRVAGERKPACIPPPPHTPTPTHTPSHTPMRRCAPSSPPSLSGAPRWTEPATTSWLLRRAPGGLYSRSCVCARAGCGWVGGWAGLEGGRCAARALVDARTPSSLPPVLSSGG